MTSLTNITAQDAPLVSRAHRHLARLDAAAQRDRFNIRARRLAEKLRAEIALTESEYGPVLASNPHLTSLAIFLRDYGAAIESACWVRDDVLLPVSRGV